MSSENIITRFPKVNAEMARTMLGHDVEIIGKVESTSASTIDIVASDGGRFRIIISHPLTVSEGPYVQVVGRVTSANEILAGQLSTLPGQTFDMNMWNEMLKKAAAFQTLF